MSHVIEILEGLSDEALGWTCRELANQLAKDEPEVCVVLAVVAKRLIGSADTTERESS